MSSDHDHAQVRNGRLLTTLEQLLAIEATELKPALDQASQLVAEVLGADKVDVFLYDAASESLVAMGTSATPMGRRQHQIGLNRQPLANGGSVAQVYQSGQSQLTGHADQDPTELKGVIDGLGVRSAVTCPLQVAGERRGVVQAVSATPNAYVDQDLRFFEAVARWIGMVTHRTELFEQTKQDVADQSRRAAVDELISLLTPRQREVAALIASGLTNAQIAERLVISAGTVANHVESILTRLGAQRRAQVAAWIAEAGLLQPSPDGHLID